MTDEPQERRPSQESRRPRNAVWLMFVVMAVLFLAFTLQQGGLGGRSALSLGKLNEMLHADPPKVVKILLHEGEGRAEVTLTGEQNRAPLPVVFHSREHVVAFLERWEAYRKEWAQVHSGETFPTDIEVEGASTLMANLVLLSPWLILFFFLWIFVRQLRVPGGGPGMLSFGKSRARMITKEKTNVTFDHVAGIDEAKQEVGEIIDFLRTPEKFARLGGRIPRGVLLVGAPGTGKTLLAKAIAGEANVPFFSISGSDFVEMFVGVGASRVRDLFQQAKENSPCIIFLDEIDAVGRKRGSGLGGGHDEREQTLNAILVEMDGFESDQGVIVVAATNRPDVLDPALLRPGRFDREIIVDLPDVKGREAILKVHARRVKLSPEVDLKILARGTPGFSGAELEAVINEGAIIAAMDDQDCVHAEHLEESRDKVRWGRKKASRVMDEAERRTIAYHEAGHAVVAKLLPDAEPLHKVTIIPMGMAGGVTMLLPERDRYLMPRRAMLATLKVLYAGRISEELYCGDISTGAANDIERASELARAMICKYGMSETLGPVSYSSREEHVFLGNEISRPREFSESTQVTIDEEVRRVVDACYQDVKEILVAHEREIAAVAVALLKYESLSGSDVAAIFEGQDIDGIKAKENGSKRLQKTERAAVRSETAVPGTGPVSLGPAQA